MLYLVQATLSGETYTHYTCQTKENANRLAKILTEKRPNILPIEVVEWEPTPEQLARIYKFADDSPGPKYKYPFRS